MLSLSSGPLLSIILQLGVNAWNHILRNTQQRWWGFVGLFVLAYIMIDLLSNRTPTKVFMSYATFSAHTAYWRGLIFEYGMQNVWAHPLFGIGTVSYTHLDVYKRQGQSTAYCFRCGNKASAKSGSKRQLVAFSACPASRSSGWPMSRDVQKENAARMGRRFDIMCSCSYPVSDRCGLAAVSYTHLDVYKRQG